MHHNNNVTNACINVYGSNISKESATQNTNVMHNNIKRYDSLSLYHKIKNDLELFLNISSTIGSYVSNGDECVGFSLETFSRNYDVYPSFDACACYSIV